MLHTVRTVHIRYVTLWMKCPNRLETTHRKTVFPSGLVAILFITVYTNTPGFRCRHYPGLLGLDLHACANDCIDREMNKGCYLRTHLI